MALPLYLDNRAPEEYQPEFNTGLWYDKFCHNWQTDNKFWSLKSVAAGRNVVNPKLDWMEQVARKPVGSNDRINEMKLRMSSLVDVLDGAYRIYKTEWRFVTGLGRNHPVENGFAWHATLGTPYLPGSSVKGLVLNWVKNWLPTENGRLAKTIARIFGSKETVGNVIFFDALPIKPVKLAIDVMTPHYSEYYQQQGNVPPADWLSPNPIPFLTVAAGQQFLFLVAPRCPGEAESKDCQLVLGWLEEALTWTGAGAKTAAGYGRFLRDQKEEAVINRCMKEKIAEQQQAQRKMEIAQMSPLRREMEEDGYSDQPDRFMDALTLKWQNRLDETDQSPEAHREIAELLFAWYQIHKSDQWKKPNKKNQAKIDKIKAALSEKY